MTREEELDWLCRLRSEIYVYMPKEWLIPMNNALDMAISDLSENKGEWIKAKVGKLFPSNDYKCSICGNILDFNGVNCGRGDANFCPNCGADMRGKDT